MSLPIDDFRRVYELHAEGFSACAIEKYTGVSRCEIRRILRLDKQGPIPLANDDLSVRERQALLQWPVVT